MLDYRKFFGSRELRKKILSLLSWVPDRLMIRIQYFLQTGKKLNLKNPETFNEKMQWYKLNYHDPEMLRCTDKVEIREYLKEKGFGNLIVPIIAIYEKPEDLDFKSLPEKFVIKTSDGSGANEVMVCHSKKELGEDYLKNRVEEWFKTPKKRNHEAREWAYNNGYPRRVIVEELIEEPGKKDIDDYKFYCFQGKYKFLQWHKDRHSSHKAGHYDENREFLPEVRVSSYPSFEKAERLPDNFEEMVEIAETISKAFPFVRVDLYNINKRIYIGELTFYPASGYFNYQPPYVDKWLGTLFSEPLVSYS